MKRERETEEERISNHHCFAFLPATVVVVISEYLTPPSLVSLMKVSDSLCQTLSRYYCPNHGLRHAEKGFLQEEVEERIQRDGDNVMVFHEKLASRTAKVDSKEWHCESTPLPYRTLPLDFDPVYRKYLEMLKECQECELKATNRAMAGIGLEYCDKCSNYVDTNYASSCQDCQDASCCHDCDGWNGCDGCGSHGSKEYFCASCRPMVCCGQCKTGYCTKHKQIEMCNICRRPLCQRCHKFFDKCHQCKIYICSDHGKTFFCKKCTDLICCWKCKKLYHCVHDGLSWRLQSSSLMDPL